MGKEIHIYNTLVNFVSVGLSVIFLSFTSQAPIAPIVALLLALDWIGIFSRHFFNLLDLNTNLEGGSIQC